MSKTIKSLFVSIFVLLLLSQDFFLFSIFATESINEIGIREKELFNTDNFAKLSESEIPIINTADAVDQVKSLPPRYSSNEVIIKYKTRLSDSEFNPQALVEKQSFFSKYNLNFKNSIYKAQVELLEIKDGKSVEEKINELTEDPNIEYAEPNYYYELFTNDTQYYNQWYLENNGQYVNGISGIADADIDAPQAWEVFSRNPNELIVAVIDSGVAYNHPDLINQMWNGQNCMNEYGIYIGNCIHGYDFINNDKDPYPLTDEIHGTHVAGIISAEINNNEGISGINPNVKLMALKSSINGQFDTNAVVRAIYFSLYNEVSIINMSFGGTSYSQTLYDAVQAFNNSGGLVVAAAGNNSTNNDSQPIYPSSFNLNGIISVASTNQLDNVSSFSNYGPTSVDLGAPGSNILSTIGWESSFYEDFESAIVPLAPYGWTFIGNPATTNMTINGFPNQELVGDYFHYPYSYNSDYSMISPLVNLNGFSSATIDFDTLCDTETSNLYWYDYMTLELSRDNAGSFQELLRFNETSLQANGGLQMTIDNYYTGYYFHFSNISIPLNYLTSTFRLKFRWRADNLYSYYYGCWVDNIKITQATSSINSIEKYKYENGTSMAAPVVSAAASLVWGYRPNLTNYQVKDALMNSGDTKASLIGKTVSGKRLNINNALLYVQGDVIQNFSFNIPPNNYMCTISEKYSNINCSMPSDVDKSNLSPTINLTGGTIEPQSGVSRDFRNIQNYTLTKSNSSVENYNVYVHNTFSPNTLFRSGQYNWGVANTKYITSGDYDGDGQDEIAAMYDYGQEDMALIVFSGDGNSFNPNIWFRSGAYNWGVPYTKYLTSGDFDNDGKDEIAAMYDYGREDMALIVFDGNNNTFSPSIWFRSGPYNWGIAYTKYVTAGDFDNDGRDELSAMYDYGREDMALIVFDGNNSFSPTTWFRSGAYNWGIAYTKYVTAGDFNNDGKDELAAMYDYGREDMALIVFNGSNYFSPTTWFRSGAYNWGIAYTKYVTAGDFNNDGKDELTAMYDYGNQDMSLIVFNSTNSTFSPESWFRSGAWNWSINNTKFVTPGDFNGNEITELGAIYDYTHEDMSIIVFK